jgi:ATP-dependent protease ClpP protease subunit
MRKGLMAFYQANKGKGAALAVVQAAGGVTIEVYDVIVANEADAAFFGGVSAQAVIGAIRAAGDADVALRINSPGGDVFAGVAMAQAIREHKGRVTAHVDGYAASAASLLVAAADEAVISPSGMVMIHKAWTIAMGNADDMMATAGLLEKIDSQLVEAYREKAGDTQDWAALMTAETWFTAAEAVEAGLVNRVAEKAEKKMNVAFDLSAYANAPALIADVEPPAAEVIAQADPEHERRRAMARLALATAA